MTAIVADPAPTDAGAPRARPWTDVAERVALPALLLVVVAVFSLLPSTSDTFPTSANLQAVVGNQSVLAIAALAAVVPLVGGQFDLSVGAVLGAASIVAAVAWSEWGWGLVPGALAAIGVGAGIGLVNGLLITRARVNALIVTLGMATVLAGLVTLKTDGQSIVTGMPAALIDFGTGTTLGLPSTVIVLAVVALLVAYVLGLTPFGRHLHAVGSNPAAARLVGVHVDRVVVLSFVCSGTLAAAAGVLQIGRAGSGNPQIGENFTLPALAAAFLSAAAIRPGRFNVGGVLVAIFFLAALTSGLNLAGVEGWVNDVVNGAALIAGVGLAGMIGRLRRA